ncbi:MAG: FAD-binding oxidoreductase [SAR324 cluster bacterium]|jgi:gamma-glutamylputrescine oxidase|nr:FAD-binding oxidoreductase [SAR324 cluster bacterium]MDP6248017.1 FAD-binding oxidoreductase [SAR324 cluster bacterium]|tara:strand:- start:10474 stop:11781 length:1308 start_codon:yes stop_codon:yes gene_type:complete
MPAQLAFETQSTWYEAQANRPPIGEPLKEVVETETCIVGAGLAGLYLAKELSERNRPALIVEARRVGLGASGRHGGFCGPGWALEAEKIEKHVGLEQAKTLFDLSLEGFHMVQEVLDSGEALMTPGILHPSTYHNAEDLLKNRDKMAKEYGYEVDYLETDAVRTMLDTSRYYQAYRDPKAFHFDALKLCLTLAEVLQKMGVPVYENSGMKEFHKTSMGWELTTEQGSVRCKQLVFCCGGYGGREFAKLRRAFLPITTYVIVTPPLGEKLKKTIQTSDGVSDERRAGNYYRIVDGDRLLWGGDITAFGEVHPERISQKMGRDLVEVYPQLANDLGSVPVEYSWSGLMGYARHLMPEIGPLDQGLWACTSFGGHGANTAPIGARLIAEAICLESERWRLFEAFGFPWNGGPFGPYVVESVYRKMQLGDHWRAIRSRW